MFTYKGFRKFYNRSWNLNKECDVLILVEHTVRELESAVVLTEKLQQLGISVAIDSPKWNINRLPILYRPKCVLVPWVYSKKEMNVWRHFKDIEGKRSIIVNLHHEQITGSNSADFVLPNSESKDVYHLCWGTDYYDSIESLVPPSTRLLYGSLRLELVRRINTLSSTELVDSYRLGDYRRLLYLSNSFHLQKESEVNYFETRGVSLKDIARSGKANTLAALESFKVLLTRESDLQIIYRPHPSMIDRELDFKPLQDLAQEFPERFRIIGDHGVHHWISLVDAVLTFHSTCFAEAYVLNKPFALYRFYEMPPDDEPEIFELVPKLTNQQELDGFIQNPKYTDIEGFDRFYYNSNVDSMGLMVKFIQRSVNGVTQPLHSVPSFLSFMYNYMIFYVKYILNILAEYTFLRKYFLSHNNYRVNNFVWMSGSDAYNEEDIEKYTRLYK